MSNRFHLLIPSVVSQHPDSQSMPVYAVYCVDYDPWVEWYYILHLYMGIGEVEGELEGCNGDREIVYTYNIHIVYIAYTPIHKT